jgi:hypothetical protein
MNHGDSLRFRLEKVQRRALTVGAVALLVCVVGALLNPVQFFHSYLHAYLLWLGLSLGSLALLMLHHLVGGTWGFVIQRFLETGARMLPLMALLLIPVLFGIPQLYEWSHPEAVAADPILQEKTIYLNVPFFIVRAVIYFAVWIGLAYLLTTWSRRQDHTADPLLTVKSERLSAPGLVLYALTITFASFDWVMSLQPHWFSTIFGIIFMVGQGLSATCLAIIMTALFARRQPLAGLVTTRQFHDLGNLLLAFVMLWAYVAFAQFLIIWSGNLPETVLWYTYRMEGGWGWIAFLLITFHFAVPFLLLLSRRNKKRPHVIWKLAAALLVMRQIDLFWMVAPELRPGQLGLHWLDIVTPVAIGGIWIAVYAWLLVGTRLLPKYDPRLMSIRGEVEEGVAP